MAKLDIITLPDRKLRMKSAPVERVDDDLRKLMDSMLETMYAAPGIGLAAVQVNVPRRVVTIDVAQREDETAKPDPLFLINPEILWSSDDLAVAEEGCLSIPEYFAEVERPAKVRVAYIDRDGKPQEIEAEGVLAVLQHEIDHLDGKLFIDHLSKLKRDMVIKKFAKQAANRGPKSPFRESRAVSPGCRCASPSSRHARLRRADADRDRRPGPRGRRPSIPSRRAPPAAAWRRRKSPVHEVADRFGLPVCTPREPETPEARRPLRRPSAPMSAWSSPTARYCPRHSSTLPANGCLNLHASLLPRWRGAAPVARAIMAGDAETGVMVMRMEAGLDTGPVAMAERIPIGPDATAGELAERLAALGADLMVRALAALSRGVLGFTPQAGGGRHLRQEDRQGRDPHRLVAAGARGPQPHPRPIARSRRLVRGRFRQGPGAGEGPALDACRRPGARHGPRRP